MPRSNQKRRMSSNASQTSFVHQLRSGCSGRKLCRYHWPVASSNVQVGPPKTLCQLFGGPPSLPSAQTYQSR